MKVHPSIKPRRWQIRALEIWSRNMRGVARVVTGGGKTVFAYLCIQSFLDRYPDGRIVIIVPTIALLDQWYIDLVDSTDISEDQIACYSGTYRPPSQKKVSLLVLNTARETALAISTYDESPKILIVDECHRAGSPQNALALRGEYKATLGLSATPERESDAGFEEYIAPALGSIFYKYNYNEARKDGVITDFDLINIEIESVPVNHLRHTSSNKSIDDLIRSRPLLSDPSKTRAILEKRLAQTSQIAIRIPWAVKLALVHRDQRVIIFHERVASLNRILTLLEKYGQNAVTYHSHLTGPHRRDNLRLFRKGIVVNALHPHWSMLEGENAVVNYLRHCVYDGVAEYRAAKLSRLEPDSIKRLKDAYLRVAFELLQKGEGDEDDETDISSAVHDAAAT